ncbi:MAG: 4Fe-4S binding protein [Actinobacteria bacterium]|nr:4Fe-4S binding protein [Actinomycetota bacterium]
MTTTTRSDPSRAMLRKRSMSRLHWARYATQAFFAVFILVAALRHQQEKQSGAPSVDALCPFGAVESLYTWVTTGTMVPKLHPSNMILGAAVLVSVLIAGNAFCGWICPMGTLGDVLTGLRRRLGLRAVAVPDRVDRVLRYGRYVVLAAVVIATVQTGRLIFAEYDPYVTLFSLHWIFEMSSALIPALVITVVVLAGSLVVDRLWCRYLCPAGAVFAVAGHLSFLRIRRHASACTDCGLCNPPCPVGIDVAHAQTVNTDCVGCMECVATCPFPGALTVTGPTFLGSIGRRGDGDAAAGPESATSTVAQR